MTVQAFTIVNGVIRIRRPDNQKVVREVPALYSLYQKTPNGRFVRVRTQSYPYAQAMRVWYELTVGNPNDYKLRAVNPDFLEAR